MHIVDDAYLRIRRARNNQSPFEFIAQRMENEVRAYKGGRILENDLVSRIADLEAESDHVRELLPMYYK